MKWILRLLPVGLVMGWFLFTLTPMDGEIGSDYHHFVPRLLIGLAHVLQNGLSIPYYTANLCGGIPFFADPQNFFFSPVQWLGFVVSPLWAVLLCVLAAMVFGFFGMRKLLAEEFKVPEAWAGLGGLVFVANGYVWEGIFVGHVFNFWFYAYPWLLLCLVRGNALGFSLLVTFLVYGGGMHQLVIFSGVLLLLLPWLLPRLKLRTVWLSALLILLTCGGKLLLAVDYSPLFHVNPPIHKMTDPVWVQVFRFLWFDPLHTPHVGVERVGFLGPWEVIGFASRILIPLLVIGTGAIGVFLAKRRLKPVWVLGGVVCLGVFIAIATGSALNLYLPFFRTYHNPIKMLAGLIPALVVFGFWGVSRMAMPRKLGTVIVVLASVFVVGEMAFNSGFFVLFRTSIGYGWSDGPWSVVKKNRSIRVRRCLRV
jgi:hypothetical protein